MSLTEPIARIARNRGLHWPGHGLEQFAHALVLCVLCFIGERLAEAWWAVQDGIPALCVAPPLLMAWLLIQPMRTWLAASAGAALGAWLSSRGADGMGMAANMAMTAGLPLPPLAVAWLLRRHQLATWPPETLRRGSLLLLAIGVLLPLLDVAWLSLWHFIAGATYGAGGWPGLLFTHAAGHLLLVPVALAIPQLRPPVHAQRMLRDLCIAAVLAALPGMLWSHAGQAPLPSALMTVAAWPLLLWSLLRFGLGGACLALLACGVAGLGLSVRGAGPFAGLPVHVAVLSLQAWLCATGAAMWLIGAAVERQRVVARQLREAYRQLSGLTGRILVVQEEERTRIARDLHDDINQSLAALSIRLSYLKRGVEEGQREAVAELQQDLLKVSNDIRDMSHSLHPAMLRFTGLGSALSGFCQGQAQRSTLRIHCEVAPPEGLDDARELDLFRIVQEALNNVEKHARAHEAWVRLHCEGATCVLSVCDDGVGLPTARHRTAGLGLISMGERARLLGGQLAVTAREGGGTRLEVRFPLP